MKRKNRYVSPQVEVIELQNEATVMTGSLNGMNDNTWAPKVSSSGSYSAPATNSDLEDMIDGILTIEN